MMIAATVILVVFNISTISSLKTDTVHSLLDYFAVCCSLREYSAHVD